MRLPSSSAQIATALLALPFIAGCGTTRTTDTGRAASEMLLVSQAIDQAVAQIDFSPLNGQMVFLDTTAVDKDVVDKGYLISLIRQQLLANGALIQEERSRSVYVVEVRSGGIGTDRHSLLVGTPAISLPSLVPGIPTGSIPELALIKRNDQRGIAKVGVFAYNRITGRALWQSGTVDGTSRSHDTWVFGTGPFSRGTIRQRTELAGEPLTTFPLTLFHPPLGSNGERTASNDPTHEQFFPISNLVPAPPPIPSGMLGVTGTAALVNRPIIR